MAPSLIGLLAAAILFVLPTSAAAQTFPALTGRVVDGANLLDPGQEAAIDAKLAAVEQRSGRQFVVVTLASLQGRTIEDFGYRLGREWKIGDEAKDDGTLLIVAPKERKVRIETGYGARVFLTDAVSSVIVRNSILPRFKANDYAGGIAAGVDAISAMLELPPAEAAKRAQEIGASEAKRSERGVNPFPVFLMVIIFFIVISSISRRAGGKRYKGRRGGIDPLVILWGLDAISRSGRGGGGFGGFGGGSGFGGGGGFSGGGGSFGGGGASGGW